MRSQQIFAFLNLFPNNWCSFFPLNRHGFYHQVNRSYHSQDAWGWRTCVLRSRLESPYTRTHRRLSSRFFCDADLKPVQHLAWVFTRLLVKDTLGSLINPFGDNVINDLLDPSNEKLFTRVRTKIILGIHSRDSIYIKLSQTTRGNNKRFPFSIKLSWKEDPLSLQGQDKRSLANPVRFMDFLDSAFECLNAGISTQGRTSRNNFSHSFAPNILDLNGSKRNGKIQLATVSNRAKPKYFNVGFSKETFVPRPRGYSQSVQLS